MLRALTLGLLVVAPLSGLALFATANDPPAREERMADLVWSEHHLSAQDHLPGANGWFAFPITVDRPAYVRFTLETAGGGEKLTESWLGILSVEGTTGATFFGSGDSSQQPLLEAGVEGETITCCFDATAGWSWGMSRSEAVVPLAPGDVAWIGLAAADWDAYDGAFLTASGQAFLTLGEPRTGDRVEAIDLAREAANQGVRAQLFGLDAVVEPGSVTKTWTSEHFGILALDAWVFYEGGSATMSVEVPGIEARSVELDHQTPLWAAAHRAGTFSVSLEDLQAPPPGLGNAPLFPTQWLDAKVIFADVDVPGDVAFIYP